MEIRGFEGNFIEELKNRSDIVDVVSSYVPSLTKKGANYWGNCPFHHEKTPSFSVNREQGFFKCFGCGKGGDVITFVMEEESMTFSEAIKFLADRAHLEVPKKNFSMQEEDARKERERLYSLMRDAARIYHANLKKPTAVAALEYIQKRGISDSFVTRFGLGFSEGKTEIVSSLEALGYSRREMLKAGVLQERDGKIFDAMANRLVFPIIDAFGHVIAFGGRVLGKTDFAKYKNTDNTVLFVKNRNLYGLNLVKKLRQREKVTDLIMVEGYMDTLALVQAGVENVVASMGTSLTEWQARLARRFVDDIYICYDGDSAGQNATLRGLDILKNHGLNVRVISLPNGEDPDEVIKRAGVEEFLKYKNAAKELTEYKLERLKEHYDLSIPYGRAMYLKDAAKILSELSSDTEKDGYASFINKTTGFSKNVIMAEINVVIKENASKNDNPVMPSQAATPALEANVQAARFVLRQCVMGLEKWENYRELMPTEALGKAADYLTECQMKNVPADVGTLYHVTTEDEADKIINLEVKRYEGNEKAAFIDCVTLLKKEFSRSRIAELNEKYRLSTNDEERATYIKAIAAEEEKYRRAYGSK